MLQIGRFWSHRTFRFLHLAHPCLVLECVWRDGMTGRLTGPKPGIVPAAVNLKGCLRGQREGERVDGGRN